VGPVERVDVVKRGAIWPPPWDRAQISVVLSVLAALARCRPPEGLPRLANGESPDEEWHRVLAEPSEFLSLAFCDADWLDKAGPVLRAAAAEAPLAGGGLLHCDVRSDNLCFRSGSALLVDWNLASIGNPQVSGCPAWRPRTARPQQLRTALPWAARALNLRLPRAQG
jgi:hypothetical protein